MNLLSTNSGRRGLYYSGLRIALLSAAVMTILAISGALLFFRPGLWQLALLASSVFLLGGATVYLSTLTLQAGRIRTLNRISRNISRKQFEEYGDLNSGHHDELDFLVTQSIRASKTVEREIKRLNKIENYRKEFIGDISHELKTPIFAIQGFVETLLDGALEDPKVNRLFLTKAMRNVNRLSYLTKDLMEISRLETGELPSSIQTINLAGLILDVVESLQYKAQKEDVEIRVGEIDRQLQVRADRNQIRQVLVNLIENGMKYNRPGGYVIVGIRAEPLRKNRIWVYVKDTGIGIEQKDIKRVTERFFRVDKSRSREKGGTGLGLSIVKHIIEAHGEELSIDSRLNEGSTFSFTLTRTGAVAKIA